LANKFKSNDDGDDKEEEHFLPVSGKCPKCEVHLMWGDLVKYRLSLYKKNAIDKNDLATGEDEAENGEQDDDDDEEFVERDEDSD
jgi:hypothetical protein